MSIALNTNTQSLLTQSNLLSKNAVNKNTHSLSIGIEVNTGANNAAGVFMAAGVQNKLNASEQCQTNISFGINLLQTADSGLSGIQDNVSNIRDICEKFASGEGTPEERAEMQKQINASLDNIDQIANTSSFAGINLLCSTGNHLSMGLNIQVGVDSGNSATSIQIDGVFGSADSATLFSAGIDITQDDGVQQGLSACDDALKALSERRSKITDAQASLKEAADKLAKLNGTEPDEDDEAALTTTSDLFLQTANYTQQLIMQQISSSIMLQANQAPRDVMALM